MFSFSCEARRDSVSPFFGIVSNASLSYPFPFQILFSSYVALRPASTFFTAPVCSSLSYHATVVVFPYFILAGGDLDIYCMVVSCLPLLCRRVGVSRGEVWGLFFLKGDLRKLNGI